jgi:hypothetical protein
VIGGQRRRIGIEEAFGFGPRQQFENGVVTEQMTMRAVGPKLIKAGHRGFQALAELYYLIDRFSDRLVGR